MKICCHLKNNKLFIEITNPFIGEIANHFNGEIANKNDLPHNEDENHGIGSKSIIAACEKYKGIYSFEAVSNVFTLRVII